MTAAYGVTPAGFIIKPFAVIQAEIVAKVLNRIRNDIDVSADQPLGQLIGIFSESVAEVWELAQVGYNATNRGAAEDALLDNIGGINGTRRLGQQPSTVACNARFTAAGSYAAGALVAYLAPPYNTSVQFTNLVQVVVPNTGDMPGAIGPGNPYTAKGVLFALTIDGPNFGEALIAADTAAGSPQLIGMVPVAGWLSIVNSTGVTIGSLVEEDTPYRLRQYQDLSAPGSSTMAAIAADILLALQDAPSPPGLATVQMYENTTLLTDVNGLPGKSFMAVVFDGAEPNTTQDDPLIAQAIVNNKPAGGQSYGTTSGIGVDPQGVAHTVFWTRPTAVPIYFTIQLAVAHGLTGDQQTAIAALVSTAIAAASQGQPFLMYGATFNPQAGAPTTLVPGGEVVAMAFRAIAMGQAGVLDVPNFTLGTSPAPAGTGNLTFSVQQLATIDTGNITFTFADLS